MRFAAFSYHTTNLGDDIQTLAAVQYLPRVDYWIDRDWVATLGARTREPVCLIANGWYMHSTAVVWVNRAHQVLNTRFRGNRRLAAWAQRLRTVAWKMPYAWPPPANAEALLISMHIADLGRSVETMLSEKSLAYMRGRGAVGCRDEATLARLRAAGLEAYFSGCLTLTLQRPDVPRGDEIIFVDVPGVTGIDSRPLAGMPDEDRKRVGFETHFTRLIRRGPRHQVARALLRRYAAAQLVVTSKLHCAMPCLALGTPVLFVTRDPEDPRFQGLLPFVRHCARSELPDRLAAMDWINPPANPRDILPLAAPLRQRCEAHVRQFSR